MVKRPLKSDKTSINDPAVLDYFEGLIENQRDALLKVRNFIFQQIPDATETIKYNMPTYLLNGKPICGILANKKHIGFYPYSGSVLNQLPQIHENYVTTKGAWHIPYESPLPKADIKLVIERKIDTLSEPQNIVQAWQ